MDLTKAFRVTVFEYPPTKPEKAISELESLILRLGTQYSVRAPITILDGSKFDRRLFALLDRCIESCVRSLGALDILWLWALKTYFTLPNHDTLLFLKGSGLIESWESLTPFFAEANEAQSESSAANSSWFIALKGVPLRLNGGPWGACYGVHPCAVAVDATGYMESIFHEFLHIFGVEEGYQKETKVTDRGCEDCWMQYDATRGSGLCATHLGELKAFIAEGSTQQ